MVNVNFPAGIFGGKEQIYYLCGAKIT